MASLNRVILIGNLTRDPELRYTPSGRAVANFGIAVNRIFTNKDGEKIKKVDFFNIVVWAKQAENCAEYLHKGSPAAIEGRLQSRSWETSDGDKRNTVEVVADNVQFLGRPGGDSSRQSAPSAAKEPAEISLDEEIPF
ncbi:MAG TPA: single-stranded DNA-binding protein [Actinobacteria bacterium]|nr:single-stranded DNA-binding protein [Actinomycetes bacterium]HEX21702.1 single-stranded DNA-binding protein [Actinomycetota bacterium]